MMYFYKLILKETDVNEEQKIEEEWERERENIQVQLYIAFFVYNFTNHEGSRA